MARALDVKNLSIWYNLGGEPAIHDINLTVDEGEFVLLVGRTGSGKSTLLNSINGVIPNVIRAKVQGSVKVFGKETKITQLKDLSTLVGTVYQTPEDQIFSLVVEDDVAFGPENLALSSSEIKDRVDQSIELVGLQSKKRFPTFLLSGGQKQRLVIADALAMRPKMLILDEPTSMLDSLGTAEVFSTLKKLRDEFGMTIIMAEHKVERVLGLVDRLVLINDKSIAIDKPIREALLDDLNKYGIEEPQVSYVYKLIGGRKSAPITVQEFLDYEKEFVEHFKGSKLDVPQEAASRGKVAVEFDGVSFMYERSKDWVFKNIDFNLYEGEFVSLVGPNGSGKTTALRLISGLQKPSKGQIRILGRPIDSINRRELSGLVGYVFQDPDQMLFNTNVLSEVEFTPRLRGLNSSEAEKKALDVLSLFGLAGYKSENPHRLSVGQRRLLSIASVLVNEPKILLLDEPTRGLDWETGEDVLNFVKKLVKERNMAVIAVSHNMKQAADHSDRVIAFYNGGIVANGDPRSVFSQAEAHPEWSLVPPQIFQLTYSLGMVPPAIRISEMKALISSYVESTSELKRDIKCLGQILLGLKYC
ncbi:MAG: ABC transporter ATP-binding protein [Thermoprotei archaeon]